jgi:hypothetical protein
VVEEAPFWCRFRTNLAAVYAPKNRIQRSFASKSSLRVALVGAS